MRNGAGYLLCTLVLAAGVATGQQSKQTSKHPIKDIMERTHKEKGALVFRVRDGESTEEDNKKLLAEYKSLAALKPPLGDLGTWKKRTAAAIAAIQELVDNKPDAVERVRSATDCKACHDAHRVGGNK